jgi:hypothetical protein
LQYVGGESLAEASGKACYGEERQRNGGIRASPGRYREEAADDGEIDHGTEHRSDNRPQRPQGDLLRLRGGEIEH